MTLVVTTASENGITVVGDRAVTRLSALGVEISEAQKVWYSPEANVALAFWGNADLPSGEPLEEWARRFVSNIKGNDNVATISSKLVDTLNPELESLENRWSHLRRGIHVSGYEDGLPVISHVHTGDPRAFHHALEVHRDYPDIHGSGVEPYRQYLQAGGFAQLRNGYYELFATLARTVFESQKELSSLLGVPTPAHTLHGQAAFDEALVRLAGGLLKSTTLSQSVGIETDVIAFTQQGRMSL